MRTLTLLLAGSVACGTAPCPATEEPLVLEDLRTVDESAQSPCELAGSEEMATQAMALASALARKDGPAVQRLVHPERGIMLQWSRPVAWAKLPQLFDDETRLRGWCAADKRPFEAPPHELLRWIVEPPDSGQPRRVEDMPVRTTGRWRYTGMHSGVCQRRGDQWGFSDEAFVELEGGLVVVFAPDGARWLASALLRLDLGSPCG